MENSRDGDEGRAGVTGVSGQSLPGRGEAGAKVMPGQTVAAGPGSLTPEERAAKVYPPPIRPGSDKIDTDCLRGIADAIRAAVAEEREACAKEADGGWWNDSNGDSLQTAKDIAAAIRARGQS